jgi:predicted glutamine amidotransferase
MNRYKITFSDNTELLLYKCSESEITQDKYKSFGTIKTVEIYTDKSHEDYISKIKQLSEFIGYDNRNHEVYKCNYYKGYVYIYLAKDSKDNTYYDYALYQEHIEGRLLTPITKTMSTPKEVYNLITIQEPGYIIYSHRYYGEPKLTRPKELKGIKQIGSVDFIPNKCKIQIFLKDNDVYLKHTDYFSSSWKPPKGERMGMPLSYYMKKYFDKDKKDKFVYPDGWGDIVLRNEAWILLKDILPLIQTENEVTVAQKILYMQKQERKYSYIGTCNECEWERFWERVVKCIKQNT